MDLLQYEKYYHIYNHANGSDNLFCKSDNYYFFLKKYNFYISPIANTFAYCLMPNHFHLCVKIKSRKELIDFFKEKIEKKLIKLNKSFQEFEADEEMQKLISLQFSHLFNSYTQAYNKQQNRKGSLFQSNFKRKEINSDEYLRSIIYYIHKNPIHHEFVNDVKDYPYSSYNSFFTDKATNLSRKDVIDLFENIQNFYYYHQKAIDFELI